MLKYKLYQQFTQTWITQSMWANKQSAHEQTHRKFDAVTRGACCNLKNTSDALNNIFIELI